MLSLLLSSHASTAVLGVCAEALRYSSLIFLLPPPYNRGEWNFLCGAQTIQKMTFEKFNSNIFFLKKCPSEAG